MKPICSHQLARLSQQRIPWTCPSLWCQGNPAGWDRHHHPIHSVILHFASLQYSAVNRKELDAVLVRRAQRWKGGGFVCTFNIAMAEIKDFMMSSGACDELVEVWHRGFQSTVIHVTGDDVRSVRGDWLRPLCDLMGKCSRQPSGVCTRESQILGKFQRQIWRT